MSSFKPSSPWHIQRRKSQKMETMRNTPFALIALLAGWLLVSCEKEEAASNGQAGNDTTTNYSLDQAAAEAIVAELDQIAADAESDDLGQYKTALLPRCATIRRDTTQRPFRLLVDFGATNCLCRDGKTRRGLIVISHQGRPRQNGFVRTIRTRNYFVNDRQVVGQRKVSHQGRNSQGQPLAQVTSQGYRLSQNRQDTLFWNGQRQRRFRQGYNTVLRRDDSYSYRGSLQVRHSSGRGFSSQTTAPVHHRAYCPYPLQGTVEIQPQRGRSRTLDYGNGQCDSLATLRVGNRSRTIVLKR